ncbi:very short patch repair endonuclease [Granulicella sp. L60]|uniref:very short patch repair endonuclease n=1 Tax=Granulicella sp. L60 TaxID=1641866 RepID=UPI00131CC3A9
MDIHTQEQRSRNMAAIKGANTKPEMRVRSALHSMGFRFRLHRKDLPGKPDIVLAKHRTVIFVHGCFWHCHDCRWGSVVPKTRSEFWAKKRQGTTERDTRNITSLKVAGWKVLVIWECQSRSNEVLRGILASALSKGTPTDHHGDSQCEHRDFVGC